MVHQLLVLHERLLAEVARARLARHVRRQGPLQRGHCRRRNRRRGAFRFSDLVFQWNCLAAAGVLQLNCDLILNNHYFDGYVRVYIVTCIAQKKFNSFKEVV